MSEQWNPAIGLMQFPEPLWQMSPDAELAASLTRQARAMVRDLVAHRRSVGMTRQQVADKLVRRKRDVREFERQEFDSDPSLSMILRYAWAVGASLTLQVNTPRHDNA